MRDSSRYVTARFTCASRVLPTGNWGLRDYKIAPSVWGGKADCQHDFSDVTKRGGGAYASGSKKRWQHSAADFDRDDRFLDGHPQIPAGAVCAHCGAWRGSLGLEPEPGMYVAHLVEVFRAVRRVMRDDGTLWLNIGDCYQGGNRGAFGSTRGGQSRVQTSNLGSDTVGAPNRFPVAGLKPKDLCGIPWRVAFALQADGWYLRSDIIWAKCLSGGTVVYARTQKGEMPATVKDLVRLNPATVSLWDGEKWNPVVGWREHVESERQHIEVEFRNGQRIGCTRNHHWPTTRGLIEAQRLRIGDVVTWCALPEPEQPTAPAALNDEDVGWFVGLYLAEGSQSDGTLQFSGHTKEIARNERLAEIARRYHGSCFIYRDGNALTANLNGPVLVGIVATYVAGQTAHDKHLHHRCWSRSNRFLRALMVGYLEGDGGRGVGGQWRIGFTANDALAGDLRAVSARLGASLRIRRRVAINTTTGKRHRCWLGDFRWDRAQRRSPDGEVVAIRHSRARKFWDISLLLEPHIFATSGGVCTGNSNPMPESVRDRPTRSHEHLFLLSKSAQYFYDATAIAEPSVTGNPRQPYTNEGAWELDRCSPEKRRGVRPSVARGGFNGKTEAMAQEGRNAFRAITATRNRRDVWSIATQPFQGAHFATYPEKLVEPCVLAGTSEMGCCATCGAPWGRMVERVQSSVDPSAGRNSRMFQDRDPHHPTARKSRLIGTHGTLGHDGDGMRMPEKWSMKARTLGWSPTCSCPEHEPMPCTVLDPFCGSGTTGVVAAGLGRRFAGLDISPAYCRMAEERIGRLAPLFARVQTVQPEPATAPDQMTLGRD